MAFGSPEAAPQREKSRLGCLAFVALLTGAAVLVGRHYWEGLQKGAARSNAYDVLAAQRTAWNDGDLAKFTATYRLHEDLTFFSEGRAYKGWEQVNERYRLMYGGRPMGELAYDDVTIDVLNSDAAMIRGKWTVKSDAGTRTGLFTMLVRRFPLEDWKVVHDHMTIGEMR